MASANDVLNKSDHTRHVISKGLVYVTKPSKIINLGFIIINLFFVLLIIKICRQT